MEVLMMENEVSNWKDDRLDELNHRVGEGFVRVDERFVRLEGEMKEGFAKVDKEMKEGFSEIREEMRYLGGRFDRLLHALAFSAMSFVGTALVAIGGRSFF